MKHEIVPHTDGPFQVDLVLPTQFFATLRRQAPSKRGEFRLLIAVLEDAVHCFQKYVFASRGQGRRLFREAEEWIMGTTHVLASEEPPAFSFQYVCEVLSLDPAYLRRGLERWREQQLATGEPPGGPERRAA